MSLVNSTEAYIVFIMAKYLWNMTLLNAIQPLCHPLYEIATEPKGVFQNGKD